MTVVTLHFRADRLHKTCAVCKADFARHGQTDRWWLRNTWTDRRDDYHEGEGCWPGDWMVTCGRLPDDSMTPNAEFTGRQRLHGAAEARRSPGRWRSGSVTVRPGCRSVTHATRTKDTT